jgi:hypothetical protein
MPESLRGTNRWLVLLAAPVLLTGAVIPGCGPDDSDESSHLAEAAIGPEGGELRVEEPGSPAHGSFLRVPAGALESEVTLTLDLEESAPPAPEGAEPASVALRVGPEGTVFSVPVQLGVPLLESEAGAAAVFVHDAIEAGWEYTSSSRPSEEGIAVGTTVHLSVYQAFLNEQGLTDIDTGFSLASDAFGIENWADWWPWGLDGRCSGMALFAKWFFDHRAPGADPLQTCYSSERQTEIAEVAHSFAPSPYLVQEQYGVEWWDSYFLTDPDSFASQALLGLTVARKPLVVALGDAEGPEHMGLVIGYSDEGDRQNFYVYDPNHPTSENEVWRIVFQAGGAPLAYQCDGSCDDDDDWPSHTQFALFGEAALYVEDIYDDLVAAYPCDATGDDDDGADDDDAVDDDDAEDDDDTISDDDDAGGCDETLSVSIATADDARLWEEGANTNYDQHWLYIGASAGGRHRSLVWFDLSTVEGADIAEATLLFTTMSGTCRSSWDSTDCGYDRVLEVHRITDSWSAGTVTWDSAPGFDTAVVGSTVVNEPYGSFGVEYTVDITSLVEDWLTGAGANYGLMLKSDDAGEATGGSQRDVGIGSSNPHTGDPYPAVLQVAVCQ